MKAQAHFHPLAEAELHSGIAYYEAQASGLGSRFLAEVERTSQAAIEFPNAAPEVRLGVRRRLLRGFSYALIFSLLQCPRRRANTRRHEPQATPHVLGRPTVALSESGVRSLVDPFDTESQEA